MSRVPADTFFIRLGMVAALALPLAGCGGDDAPTASTPAPSTPGVSTPAPTTTPAATTATADPKTVKKPKATGKLAAPVTDAPLGRTEPIDTPETVAKASPKKKSNDDLAAQMKRAFDGLKQAGLDPGKPMVSGETSGALMVGSTTIVFEASPRDAAKRAVALAEALKDQPQFLKMSRKANRLFLISLPSKPSDEQLREFRKVRQVVNNAV